MNNYDKIFQGGLKKGLSYGVNFLFFGTSYFAILILEELKKNNLTPVLIVSTPDKPKGRGLKIAPTPVKKWAQANQIAVLQPEKLKSPEFIASLSDTRCSTAVVASYGKIIPKVVLDIFSKGILNVHPSLLPRWRGADPIRSAILAGDEKTGVSIMLIDEEMDHGPILAERELARPIRDIQYSILETKLAELGGKLLIETIPKWLAGGMTPQEQDNSRATYAKKISKEDGHINWNESAEIIERKIRALNPWPGTYAFWNEKRIKILEGWSEPGSDHKVGEVFILNSELHVSCKNGLISIKKIQLEGKKPQNAKDFLNGYPDIIGAVLN